MIELRTLGSLELLDAAGGRMESAMRRPKVIAVLAYLAAARPRGMHRREKLAALFWPELNEDRARAALRVTLSRLRDDIGDEVILANNGEEVAIDARHVTCDVVQLEDALATGDVQRASALYRGHFLDGVHVEGTADELEEWMSIERHRLRGAVVRSLIAAAKARAHNGTTQEAIGLARRAVEISPADESTHRALIQLLVALNDRVGALSAYADLERALSRTLGVAPSPEVRAMVEAVQHGAGPVVAPVPHETKPAKPHSGPSKLIWMLTGAAAAVVLMSGWVAARDKVVTAKGADVQWTILSSVSKGIRPTGRVGGAAALDSTGSLVIFGGQLYMTPTSQLTNQVWRLQGTGVGEEPFWTPLTPKGRAPQARWLMGMASDPRHDRIIVQGGALGGTSPCAGDTWILDQVSSRDAAWRPVKLRDAMPARAGYTASYDSAANRLIVFGGHDCISTFFNDVWVLAFDDSTMTSGRWSQIFPDSSEGAPGRLAQYASAYDARGHRLFVIGGSASGNPARGTWMLEHADGVSGTPRWRSLTCAGSTPLRNGAFATYDDATASLYVFGGLDSTNTHRHDLSRASGLGRPSPECRWEQLSQEEPAPSPRGYGTLVMNPRHGELMLYGGAFNDNGLSDAWIVRKLRR